MIYDLGRIALTPRGDYSPNNTYYALDFVYYNGSSYVCKSNGTNNQGITGVIPTNTNIWQILALKGEAGIISDQQINVVVQRVTDNIMEADVVVDPDYSSFKTNTKNALNNLSTPNNPTITLKRNGVAIGSFTLNQANGKEINIQVPTDFDPIRSVDIEKFVNDERNIRIDVVKSSCVMVCPETSIEMKISGIPETAIEKVDGLTGKSSLVIFGVNEVKTLGQFLTLPAGAFLSVAGSGADPLQKTLQPGYRYMLEVRGCYFKLIEYRVIS